MRIALNFLIILIICSPAFADDRLVYATLINVGEVKQSLKIYEGGVIEYDDGEKVHTYKQVKSVVKIK